MKELLMKDSLIINTEFQAAIGSIGRLTEYKRST